MKIVHIAVAIAMLLASVCLAPAQELGANRAAFFEMAKRYEVKATDEPPVWALRRDRPLFRLAWLSDLHIDSQERLEYHRRLLAQIRQDVHPTAVLVTGDNIGLGNNPVQRLNVLKSLLSTTLGEDISSIVLPGDNWPQGYDQVFGSTKFAFTLGGVRFICASQDAAGRTNGCSIYSPETLAWLNRQFATAGNRPVVFVQHEPIEPPSTLDAPKVASLMDRTPQAFLALGGHFHLNLEFKHGHWRQWVAPSTGHSHRPAFKELRFYSDCVISQDWEEGDDGTYRPVNKFLRADIPEECRENLLVVRRFSMEEPSLMPPRPFVSDPGLDARAEELTSRLMRFALQYGLKKGI